MKNTLIQSDVKQARLVIITREDLTNGYKSQQSTHAIADFAYEQPDTFKFWKETSNSIICLGVNNELELEKWFERLSQLTYTTKFYEPDLNDELTSICFYANAELRKKVSSLPLLGKVPKVKEELILNEN